MLVTATGENGPEQVEERLAIFEGFLGSDPPVTIILDTTGTNAPSVQLRRMWTDWLKENRVAIRDSCRACLLVARSPLMRGALTAVFWIWSPILPIHICSSVEEARALARSLQPDSTPAD